MFEQMSNHNHSVGAESNLDESVDSNHSDYSPEGTPSEDKEIDNETLHEV